MLPQAAVTFFLRKGQPDRGAFASCTKRAVVQRQAQSAKQQRTHGRTSVSGSLDSAGGSTTVLPLCDTKGSTTRRRSLAFFAAFFAAAAAAAAAAVQAPVPCCASYGVRRRPSTSVAVRPTSSPRVSCCCGAAGLEPWPRLLSTRVGSGSKLVFVWTPTLVLA